MLPFGETILAWRLERGMTQAGLADAAGVPRPNLSAIERGEREVTLKTLRALAVALDVTPGTLADGVSPRTSASLSRATLERIAAAAVTGKDLANPRDAELARHLRVVTGLAARQHGAARRRTRAVDRSYFLLRASVAPEAIASLLERVSLRRR